MKANLFKNFKTLKEKEGEKKLAEDEKLDNVSELEIEKKQVEPVLEERKEKQEVESPVAQKSNSEDIVKKRPVKKEIVEARAALMSNNTDSSGGYSKSIKKDQGKRTFTVFMKAGSLEFLKDLVFYKATAERQIFYSQSEAVIEALELIMPAYKSINARPDFIREQEKAKKGGRKRNSDEVYEATTTIYIPGQYYDFIKDVTYNKVIAGDLYFKDWDLLEESILKLRKKYGKNIQPRPDYIREDEKQRGRRSKTDS